MKPSTNEQRIKNSNNWNVLCFRYDASTTLGVIMRNEFYVFLYY